MRVAVLVLSPRSLEIVVRKSDPWVLTLQCSPLALTVVFIDNSFSGLQIPFKLAMEVCWRHGGFAKVILKIIFIRFHSFARAFSVIRADRCSLQLHFQERNISDAFTNSL